MARRDHPLTPGTLLSVAQALRLSQNTPLLVDGGNGPRVLVDNRWFKLSGLTCLWPWEEINVTVKNRREQRVTVLQQDIRPVILTFLRDVYVKLNWEVVREQQTSGVWQRMRRDAVINRALAYGFTRDELGLPEWFIPDPTITGNHDSDPRSDWFTIAYRPFPQPVLLAA